MTDLGKLGLYVPKRDFAPFEEIQKKNDPGCRRSSGDFSRLAPASAATVAFPVASTICRFNALKSPMSHTLA